MGPRGRHLQNERRGRHGRCMQAAVEGMQQSVQAAGGRLIVGRGIRWIIVAMTPVNGELVHDFVLLMRHRQYRLGQHAEHRQHQQERAQEAGQQAAWQGHEHSLTVRGRAGDPPVLRSRQRPFVMDLDG